MTPYTVYVVDDEEVAREGVVLALKKLYRIFFRIERQDIASIALLEGRMGQMHALRPEALPDPFLVGGIGARELNRRVFPRDQLDRSFQNPALVIEGQVGSITGKSSRPPVHAVMGVSHQCPSYRVVHQGRTILEASLVGNSFGHSFLLPAAASQCRSA